MQSRIIINIIGMIFMDLCQTLFGLAGASGTSGQEYITAGYALDLLSKFMPAHVDALGSVVGENDGEGCHYLLDAHLDSIGLVVTGIEENGFLRVDKCGGTDVRVLPAHEVIVHGKEKVFGVITSIPPHLARDEGKKAAGFDEIMIDTGLDGDKAKEIIRAGDRATFVSYYGKMLNNTVRGAYFDDKAGICAVLRCLEILKENNCNKKLSVLFSAQEETGGSGAAAAGFRCEADKSISVDVSFAKTSDTPKDITASLGKGTMIGFSPVLSYSMSCELKALAEKKNIPYQLEIMPDSTGTNADNLAVAAGGRKAALLSIPMKNMHTPVETVSLDDIEATARLMAEYIMNDGGLEA